MWSVRDGRGGLRVYVTCAALTALKLWLVSAQTVSAISPAPADDELFLNQAESLLRGNWLGKLTEYTLVKGPGYSLWLAMSHLTGVPLLLSQAFLYALACAVLARAVRPAIPERWPRALLYVALLFSPASWADGPATRVVREGIYSSISVMLIGCAFGLALRLRTGPRASVPWAMAAGLIGALFALTREEGIWLAPSLAIVASMAIFMARRAGWRAWFVPAALAAATYAVPVTLVAALNWKHYGVFETCETSAGYYKSAIGALTRIKTDSWNPYVPVSREARAKAFLVSGAFREVDPYLEENAAGWGVHGCKALKVCDDIAGGWFGWAFRDAVNHAGKYSADARVAREWYERLTLEVDEACRAGRIECLPARSSILPPLKAAYLGPFLSALRRGLAYVATFREVTPHPTPPLANEPDLARYEGITNERLPRPHVLIRGLVESHIGDVHALVVDPGGRPTAAAIKSTPVSPTERPSGDGLAFTRLSLETACVAGCHLVLVANDDRAIAIPIVEGATPTVLETLPSGEHDILWTTEAFQRETPTPHGAMRRLAVLAAATRVYASSTPAFLALAVALLIWRVVRDVRARRLSELPLLALALAAAVAVRFGIVAVVDVTSFPAIRVLYCAPAYPFLVAFIALVLVSEGAAAWRSRATPGAAS